MHPIGLSSEQFDIVKDAAVHVEHPRRHRLIDALLDTLVPVDVIATEHVYHAARLALRRMRQIA